MSKFFEDTMQGLTEAVYIEKYAKDGRLTEPSDGKRYEWRKMIDEVKRLGRPLTEKESEVFKIKQEGYSTQGKSLGAIFLSFDPAAVSV